MECGHTFVLPMAWMKGAPCESPWRDARIVSYDRAQVAREIEEMVAGRY